MSSGAILQVLPSSARRGSEVHGLDLHAALARAGADVRTVALAPGGGDLDLDVTALGPRRRSPSTVVTLRRAAGDAGVVVAHGSTTLPVGTLALLGRATPLVYRSTGDPSYWSARGTRRMWTSAMLRRAAAVVCLWRGAADGLVRRGIPAAKVHVIPNAVPSSRAHPLDAAGRRLARQRLGIEPATPVIVYVGALVAEKAVDAAVWAAGRIDAAMLLVVGDGPERHRLERLAADTAPGRVIFVGPVADPAAMLAAGDVLVLPSRTEGLSGALIEAGLCGLAAVATRVGGTVEVVRDGETGILIPPDDERALVAALVDALASSSALGAAARAHCLRHFEIDAVAEQWVDLLSRVA